MQSVAPLVGSFNAQRRVFMAAAGAAVVARSFAQNAAAATPRALLVGNTRYRPASQNILTAHKNVRDIEDALSELGYRCDTIFNANKVQVLAGLDTLLASTAADAPAFIYFCGHGINSLSRGEYRNYWVSADVELSPPAAAAQDPAARRKHYEDVAQLSPSLEEDVYPRMASRANATTFIVIDACRDAASAIADADSRGVQSRPPQGCIVGYATRPGRYAYTPRDFNQNSYYAESLIRQLRAVRDEGDMSQLLQRVRLEVRERVNGIARAEGLLERLLGQLGLKEGFLQEPDFAANLPGKGLLRPAALLAAPTPVAPTAPAPVAAAQPQSSASGAGGAPVKPAAPAPASAVPSPPAIPTVAADITAWAQVEAITDLADAEKATTEFLQRYPASALKANATIRLEDIRKVRDAARRSRVLRTTLVISNNSPVRNDYRAALQGDKFAAQRVAEAVAKTPALGDSATAQRWLQFSAELGNGIAAYEASRQFNAQNLIQEASYYLALAETNGYRPPRDFDTRK